MCLPLPGYYTNPSASLSLFNRFAYAGSFFFIGLILVVTGLSVVALTHIVSVTAGKFGQRKKARR
jgi:hypothetical protein